jgi:hypothetical protein
MTVFKGKGAFVNFGDVWRETARSVVDTSQDTCRQKGSEPAGSGRNRAKSLRSGDLLFA